MFNFLKDLTSELSEYPLEQKLEIESFCFHVGKIHHELVKMPENNARAILGHFDNLRELLDYYAAAQELRPVLPSDAPKAQGEPVQEIKLRTAYIWQQNEDLENKAQLPASDHWSGALVFNLENVQEVGALHSLLIKRIAARRVPAFCFALDYATPDGTHARASGEVWRCVGDRLELSTARVPAQYKLMGSAPANRAAQVFEAQYLAPMGQLKRIDLDI